MLNRWASLQPIIEIGSEENMPGISWRVLNRDSNKVSHHSVAPLAITGGKNVGTESSVAILRTSRVQCVAEWKTTPRLGRLQASHEKVFKTAVPIRETWVLLLPQGPSTNSCLFSAQRLWQMELADATSLEADSKLISTNSKWFKMNVHLYRQCIYI